MGNVLICPSDWKPPRHLPDKFESLSAIGTSVSSGQPSKRRFSREFELTAVEAASDPNHYLSDGKSSVGQAVEDSDFLARDERIVGPLDLK